MGCACGSTKTAAPIYVWTSSDGTTTKAFSSKAEAIAKTTRDGGSWRQK